MEPGTMPKGVPENASKGRVKEVEGPKESYDEDEQAWGEYEAPKGRGGFGPAPKGPGAPNSKQSPWG